MAPSIRRLFSQSRDARPLLARRRTDVRCPLGSYVRRARRPKISPTRYVPLHSSMIHTNFFWRVRPAAAGPRPPPRAQRARRAAAVGRVRRTAPRAALPDRHAPLARVARPVQLLGGRRRAPHTRRDRRATRLPRVRARRLDLAPGRVGPRRSVVVARAAPHAHPHPIARPLPAPADPTRCTAG